MKRFELLLMIAGALCVGALADHVLSGATFTPAQTVYNLGDAQQVPSSQNIYFGAASPGHTAPMICDNLSCPKIGTQIPCLGCVTFGPVPNALSSSVQLCGGVGCGDPSPPTIHHPATFVFRADQIDMVKPLLKEGDKVEVSNAPLTDIWGWAGGEPEYWSGNAVCFILTTLHAGGGAKSFRIGARIDIKATVNDNKGRLLFLSPCDITNTGGE